MMEKINDADINKVVSSLKFRRPRYKYLIFSAAIVLTTVAGYVVWFKYFSPQAQSLRDWQKYAVWEKRYKDQSAADKYGGQTPQETLNLFADALRKGDVDLASKYFVRNTDGSVNPEVIDNLNKAKADNKLNNLIEALESASSAGSSINNHFGFEVRNEDGKLINDIGLVKNEYSNVWKIESF